MKWVQNQEMEVQCCSPLFAKRGWRCHGIFVFTGCCQVV